MALLTRYNPEQSLASFYQPQQSQFGRAEGSTIGGPEKGAGRKALSGFQAYEDYLEAFRASPTTRHGSTGNTSGSYVPSGGGFDERTGSYSSGGYQPGQTIKDSSARMNVTYNPFSEQEFASAQEGREIGTGERMRQAAAASEAKYLDPAAMGQYATSMGGGTELMDYYKNLLQNPNQYDQSPEYQFLKQQMEESVRRTSPRLSGRRAIAAQERGGQLAQTYRGQTLGERLGGAEQERLRGSTAQQFGLQRARLGMEASMRPEELIFAEYNRTAGRDAG